MEEAEELWLRMERMGARLQASKQSAGTVTAELTRIAVTSTSARGYLARSVASAVSGNWTSDTVADPAEKVTQMITVARSLINRGCSLVPARMIARAAAKRADMRHRTMEELMVGARAFNTGPTWMGSLGSGLTLRVVEEMRDRRQQEEERVMLGSLPNNATTAYLENRATTLERAALRRTGAPIRHAMQRASFAKMLQSKVGAGRAPRYRAVHTKSATGSGWELSADVNRRAQWLGALGRFPLIQLIKEKLRPLDVRWLLEQVGVPRPPGMSFDEWAWGRTAANVRIKGVASYSDASSWCRKTRASHIIVDFPVYM
jgi:hypothetical protein